MPTPSEIHHPTSGGTKSSSIRCQERRRGSGWDKNREGPFIIAKDLLTTCQRYFTTHPVCLPHISEDDSHANYYNYELYSNQSIALGDSLNRITLIVVIVGDIFVLSSLHRHYSSSSEPNLFPSTPTSHDGSVPYEQLLQTVIIVGRHTQHSQLL